MDKTNSVFVFNQNEHEPSASSDEGKARRWVTPRMEPETPKFLFFFNLWFINIYLFVFFCVAGNGNPGGWRSHLLRVRCYKNWLNIMKSSMTKWKCNWFACRQSVSSLFGIFDSPWIRKFVNHVQKLTHSFFFCIAENSTRPSSGSCWNCKTKMRCWKRNLRSNNFLLKLLELKLEME